MVGECTAVAYQFNILAYSFFNKGVTYQVNLFGACTQGLNELLIILFIETLGTCSSCQVLSPE